MAPVIPQRTAAADDATLVACRQHVLQRIRETEVGRVPFHHMYIERIFPDSMYAALASCALRHKHGGALKERRQDSAKFVNRRFNLVDSDEPEVLRLRAIFSDPEVKLALLGKFYVSPTAALEESLAIHEEFEFVYTAAGRFQNIHIDIPSKYMSFVFYLPERDASEAEQERNATVLYDRELVPHYAARYRANSVCVFVPHFHSYHGFASTIDRDALVMFYINRSEQAGWAKAALTEQPPYREIREAIAAKLLAHPLHEYGADPARIARERERCLINAPKGRVLRPGDEASSGSRPPG